MPAQRLLPAPSACHLPQVHYLNAPVVGPWPSGEERSFYFWNAYAQTAGDRIAYIPFRAGNAGLVVSRFENQHGQEPYRIKLTVKNAAGYDLPGWQTSFRFGVEVGP